MTTSEAERYWPYIPIIEESLENDVDATGLRIIATRAPVTSPASTFRPVKAVSWLPRRDGRGDFV